MVQLWLSLLGLPKLSVALLHWGRAEAIGEGKNQLIACL